MAKKRLDGTQRGNIFWELYTFPGRAVLWIFYMFPGQGGYAQTRQTSRHARSPIMTFVYSTGIWFILVVLLRNGTQ